MAACDVEVCRTYLLILSEEEAKWLAGVTQQCLYVQAVETDSEKKYRTAIWTALTNPLIKNNVLTGT